MKMHHLPPETVDQIMTKVQEVIDSGDYPMDTMDEIFTLSGVNGNIFWKVKTIRRNRPRSTSNWTGNRASGFSIRLIFTPTEFTRTSTAGRFGQRTI